jgi:hypothetical protein
MHPTRVFSDTWDKEQFVPRRFSQQLSSSLLSSLERDINIEFISLLIDGEIVTDSKDLLANSISERHCGNDIYVLPSLFRILK